ncbi:4884_t:CDS:2 [Ambispora leptoticha]|uniref:Mediator of RNA polymerase II transcription subunit 4 n=1 Tax=Ambispora leptoticha TaxID=144679 RepID=A0A9N9D367_9GLOM|nr:4884_t:CDS:2 [Ambispora leptoticha]
MDGLLFDSNPVFLGTANPITNNINTANNSGLVADIATPAYSETSATTTTTRENTLIDLGENHESRASTFTAPLIQIINKYEEQTFKLFTALQATAVDGKPPEVPVTKIMKEIIVLDRRLQEGIEQIQEHQYYHQKILNLQNEIDDENELVMMLVEAIELGKEPLEEVLEESINIKKAIKLAQDSPMTVHDILEYANKLSKFTSPPGRPYPDETTVRQGLLYKNFIAAKGQLGVEGEAFENSKVSSPTSDQPDANPAIFDLDLNPE